MISTPYNFVPLNDKAIYPEWKADLLNEGKNKMYSGKINFTFEAHTPVFIRNGSYDQDDVTTHEFFNIEGRYLIPSSSLRGMYRSISEVLTFSGLKQVNKNRYSFRSFAKMGDGLEYRAELDKIKQDVQHGWLYQEGDEYYILPAGDERKTFGELDGIAEYHHQGKKTALDIYQSILGNSDYPFDANNALRQAYNNVVVVTGNTGSGGQTAKKFQYLFKHYDYLDKADSYEVPKQVFSDFKLAVGHNTAQESKEWAYWNKHLKNGKKIPIFFYEEVNEVQHFGLPKTYKLPFVRSVKDAIPKQLQTGIDLTDLIFGFINPETKETLKGRVRFSHALAAEGTTAMGTKGLLMGGPKASYYPFYLEQKELNNSGKTGTYNTWNSKNIKISGRKRYPVHAVFNSALSRPPHDANDNMLTKIKPLPENTVFKGSVSFQQLNQIEFGALMSTLTLHGNYRTHFFNIGMGKPMGFGKMKLDLDLGKMKGISSDEIFDSLGIFQQYMEAQTDQQWGNSATLKEFFALSSGLPLKRRYGETQPDFRYPKIKNNSGKNDFEQNIKNEGRILPPYSKLIDGESDLIGIPNQQGSLNDASFRTPMEKIEDAKAAVPAYFEIKQKDAALAADTVAALTAFMESYPKSTFCADIENRLAAKEAAIIDTAFEYAKAENTVEAYSKFLQDCPNSTHQETVVRLKKEAKAAEGLTVELIFKSYKFKDVKTVLNKMVKNPAFAFSDAQKSTIKAAVIESFALENKNPRKSAFYKRKDLATVTQHPWTDIVKWLGDETEAFYKKLIPNEK